MPENISSQFNRVFGFPIETYRSVNTILDRDSIPGGVRWEGMHVYVSQEGEKKTYELRGGIGNDNWEPISDIDLDIAVDIAFSTTSNNPLRNSTITNGMYQRTQLQTSGQAQVHWDNITNVPDLGDISLADTLSKKTKPGYKFTVLPNVDSGGTIGNTGITYNTQTDEYVIAYYAFERESKLWFYHRNSDNLTPYTDQGTLNPTPDREIDVSAYIFHIQGIAYDDSNNSYWILGTTQETSSDTERRLINVDDSGALLESTDLTSMSFQAGMLALNNKTNELIIKPNNSTSVYFLDKTTKAINRTETAFTTNEGLGYDSNRNLLWIAGDDGQIFAYDYSSFNVMFSSTFETLPVSGGQNVEGIIIDPIDDKLIISFDAYLHGNNNNGNAIFKFDFPRYVLGTSGTDISWYKGATSNVDTLTNEGYYFAGSSATGIPVSEGGYIRVVDGISGGSGEVISQNYHAISSNSIYWRSSTDGGETWSSWSGTDDYVDLNSDQTITGTKIFTTPLITSAETPEVDGTAGSGNSIPTGITRRSSDATLAAVASAQNVVYTFRRDVNEIFQLGSTRLNSDGFWWRPLSSTNDSEWARLWDSFTLPNPASQEDVGQIFTGTLDRTADINAGQYITISDVATGAEPGDKAFVNVHVEGPNAGLILQRTTFNTDQVNISLYNASGATLTGPFSIEYTLFLFKQ